MAETAVQKLRTRWLGALTRDWEAYHQLIAERLTPEMQVLDVGCGSGRIAPFPWAQHRPRTLVGLDVDPQASSNPHLDRFVHLAGPSDYECWPLNGEQFDLILARYVLEHVDTPSSFFSNVVRALKPGGEFLFLTPNLNHPAMMASAMIPLGLKAKFVAFNDKTVTGEDVFPTRYRLNTKTSIVREATRAGLVIKQLDVRDYEPMRYLDFSVPTFLLAYGYYEAVRKLNLAGKLGITIVGVLGRRQASFHTTLEREPAQQPSQSLP